MIIDEKEFKSFFNRVECRKVIMPTTIEIVSLPLVAKDGIMTAAFFTASRAKVLEIIPNEYFIPPVLPGDKTIIAFYTIEYPSVRCHNPATDIGVDPYNEILVVIPAVLGDKSTEPPAFEKILSNEVKDLVYYIHIIAVTTRMAQIIGNELLGYNKFICDIRFDDNENERKCTVKNDGELFCKLAVSPKPDNFELHRDQPIVASYNKLYDQKRIFRLKYENQAKMAISTGPDASLELGNHPLAKILKKLDISKAPIQVRYAPVFQLISDDNNLDVISL